MITRLTVRNYLCLREANLQLTPLHALIGPNDSGKSTLLRAMQEALLLAKGTSSHPAVPGAEFEVAAQDVRYVRTEKSERFTIKGEEIARRDLGKPNKGVPSPVPQFPTPRLVRLDPDELRKASVLILQNEPVAFKNDRGFGLAGVYDAIINRGDDAFAEIRSRVNNLFPAIKNVRLDTVTNTEKAIGMELHDGTRVPAAGISEGLLYYLAFEALSYIDQPSFLLVEEPENGLHPSRIADVVRLLRTITEHGTQVLLATHSPLVINELRADEVTVVTRTSKGTQLTPISKTPDFESRSRVYALGELWLSYADGKDEAPLLKGVQERPPAVAK